MREQDNVPVYPAEMAPAADQPGFASRLKEAYLQIRPFESEKLYDCLGVGVLKRLHPIYGTTVRQSDFGQRHGLDRSHLDPTDNKVLPTSENVRAFCEDMETNELSHAAIGAGLVALHALIVPLAEGHTPQVVAAMTALNYVANGIPILWSRQNRMRAERVLPRLEAREQRLAQKAQPAAAELAAGDLTGSVTEVNEQAFVWGQLQPAFDDSQVTVRGGRGDDFTVQGGGQFDGLFGEV